MESVHTIVDGSQGHADCLCAQIGGFSEYRLLILRCGSHLEKSKVTREMLLLTVVPQMLPNCFLPSPLAPIHTFTGLNSEVIKVLPIL